jgi:hypothetical protein
VEAPELGNVVDVGADLDLEAVGAVGVRPRRMPQRARSAVERDTLDDDRMLAAGAAADDEVRRGPVVADDAPDRVSGHPA